MTDPNYVALLLLIDRSGSMASIHHPLEQGLREIVADQAAQPGLTTVDVVTFDDRMEHTHSFVDPRDIEVVIEPRGRTSLRDAVGMSLLGFERDLAALPEHAKPSQVQVVVVTDGEDTSSSEFSPAAVRALVERKKTEGWSFTFIGANQDAVLQGAELGVEASSSLTFTASRQGARSMSRAASRHLRDSRVTGQGEFTQRERSEAGE